MLKVNIARKEHADGFAKAWNYKGVAIVLDDYSKQFAVDFANMILASYIEEQQRLAAEKAKPKVVLAE